MFQNKSPRLHQQIQHSKRITKLAPMIEIRGWDRMGRHCNSKTSLAWKWLLIVLYQTLQHTSQIPRMVVWVTVALRPIVSFISPPASSTWGCSSAHHRQAVSMLIQLTPPSSLWFSTTAHPSTTNRLHCVFINMVAFGKQPAYVTWLDPSI